MRYNYPQIVLQEVPDEISLALSISGCPLRCKGCHSTETYSKDFGEELTEELFLRLLDKNKHITCVLFYGGEWDIGELGKMIRAAKERGLKVALYSGFPMSFFSTEFLDGLDYIKVGPYDRDLGGLNAKTTNQRMYKKVDEELVDITQKYFMRD